MAGDGERLKGTVEWFEDAQGMGTITPSDGRGPVLVTPTSIRTEGVRSLREGEEVEFLLSTFGKAGYSLAVDVTGPGEGPLQGRNPGGGEGSGAAGAAGGVNVTGQGQGRNPGSGGGDYGGGRGGAGGSQSITCYECFSSSHATADCPIRANKCFQCGGKLSPYDFDSCRCRRKPWL